ncbi:MAG: c-type cytochrome [Gemmatimonadota bacterium]
MRNRHWMMLVAVAAFGLAACGGDANGSGAASETGDTADQMADEAPDGADAAGEATDGGAADPSQELPEGVTMAMVEEGEEIFSGAGICQTCHGADGTGLPNLGGDLTDEEWVHSDGSYEAIVETIMTGVTADESTVGVPMPEKGGTSISDEQVRAVAAYVWTLSK